MSEFSDSYHLLTTDWRDAQQLLRRYGAYGMVIPGEGPYVPFLVEEFPPGTGRPLEEALAPTQWLLHYDFGDDYGCSLTFFGASGQVASLAFGTSDAAAENQAAIDALHAEKLLSADAAAQLHNLATETNCQDAGPRVAAAVGLRDVAWLSCDDLQHQSRKGLRERFPTAQFVNVAKRGQSMAAGPQAPNQWCPWPDQPAFMYLPVPEAALTAGQEAMTQRHFRYWTEFGDFDEDTQQGYWLAERYRKALPSRYQYLGARLLNLQMLDDDARLLQTVRAVLALTNLPDEEWNKILARRGF